MVALLLAVVVFQVFNIPVYTAKDNLLGICMILLLFGFATIPMVHLFEKLFNDASLANMYILCMNIIIALTTITVIILLDILGNSEVSFWIMHYADSRQLKTNFFYFSIILFRNQNKCATF